MTLPEELREILEGDVLNDDSTLSEMSRDASLFVVRPEVVVYPKHVKDLQTLVAFVNKKRKADKKISLTARAAGTCMSGGPLGESIVVNFRKYFSAPTRVDIRTKTATAEPGLLYKDFEVETLKQRLLLPSYPASRELAAIGGLVANNSGGEKTLEFGKTADYVVGLRAVLADGKEYEIKPLNEEELKKKCRQKNFEGGIYRDIQKLIAKNFEIIENARPKVSKNSSGYALWDVWDPETKMFDLTKLFVGSQGTLGLVTEATFKLVPIRKHSKMLIMFVDDLSRLGELVNTVLTYHPETFESYDEHTLRLAGKFFPQFLKRLGFWTIVKLGFMNLPAIFSIIRKGWPKLVLQATFTGDNEKELFAKAKQLRRELARYPLRRSKIVTSKQEADTYWMVRRESFNLLRRYVGDKHTAPFIDDFVVEPKYLPEFLPKLENILKQYPITYTIAGHIGNGNFHIIPLMDFKNETERALIPEIAKSVNALVVEYGGSLTGEHNDGIIRTPFIEQMFGKQMTKIFKEVKSIFDPENIFNPGKKVGGTLSYAIEHIRTD